MAEVGGQKEEKETYLKECNWFKGMASLYPLHILQLTEENYPPLKGTVHILL